MGSARRNKSFEVEQARRDSKLAGLSRLDATGIGSGFETTPRVSIKTGGGGGSISYPLIPQINPRGNVTGTVTIDLSLSTAHYQEMTLTGNITFVFSNPPPDNQQISFILDITQDGTGGRTVQWPGTVRVDPTVGSGANARTVVVVTTVDNGSNFDALIVTGGSVTAANKALSNLSSVAINTSLISDTDNADNLGSAALEWKDLHIDGIAHIDTVDVDELLQITDTSTDPVANGDIRRNGTDVKVFSGGAVRNLTDIAGGGGANQQLSNLSGTVAVNLDLIPNQTSGGNLGSSTATEEWFNLFTRRVTFPVATTLGAGDYSFGKVSTPLRVQYNVPTGAVHRWTINGTRELELSNTELICAGVNIDMINNNITDINQLQITGTSGDTVFGLLSGASNVFDVQNPNTSGNIRLICDDSSANALVVMTIDATTAGSSNTITFEKDGSGFAILDEIGVLNFAVAAGTKPTIIGSGNNLQLNVPTGNTFDVQINSTSEYLFTTTALDFQSNSILDTDRLAFLDGNTDITDTSPGLQYDVPTGESHRWRVNNVSIVDVDLNGIKFVKQYTNAGRPTASSAGAGAMIYNSDDNGLNISDGTNWYGPSGGWVTT